jgi:AcrR family transcriptional regulator
MRLLSAGGTPTVADIAEAADVSRRTVYMYFPTLQHLLIDAALGVGTVPANSVVRIKSSRARGLLADARCRS